MQTITPYLAVRGGIEAIRWYEQAFGAICSFRQMAEDGRRVLHATLNLFDGQIMLSDEFPEFSTTVSAPPTSGGASVAIQVHLPARERVDEVVARAVEAGARIDMAPEDMFWGARFARIIDPFGHVWAFNAE